MRNPGIPYIEHIKDLIPCHSLAGCAAGAMLIFFLYKMDEFEACIGSASVSVGPVSYHYRLFGPDIQSFTNVEEGLATWLEASDFRRFPHSVEADVSQTAGLEFFPGKGIVGEDSHKVAFAFEPGNKFSEKRSFGKVLFYDAHLGRHVTSAEPFPAAGRCARGALAHEIEKGVVIIIRTRELLAFQYLAAFSLSCEHPDVQGVGGDEPKRKMTGLIQSPVNIEYYSLYVIHEV